MVRGREWKFESSHPRWNPVGWAENINDAFVFHCTSVICKAGWRRAAGNERGDGNSTRSHVMSVLITIFASDAIRSAAAAR